MRKHLQFILMTFLATMPGQLLAQVNDGQTMLYVSKQTGEFSKLNGSNEKTTDQYESGQVTLSTDGPISYSMDPDETSIGPNETKTWNGELFPNIAQAPAAGTSVDAQVSGDWDVEFSRPVGAGSGGTVLSTYTCSGCAYHGTDNPGEHEIVNKLGTEVVPVTIYSIKATIPDIDTFCAGEVGSPFTVETFPPHGGDFLWTTNNPAVTLMDADKQTVKVALTGVPGMALLNVKWTIEGVSYTDQRNIFICGSLDDITVADGDRTVNAGGTLEVVPPLIGKNIDLTASPGGVTRYCNPDPLWNVTGYWTSTLSGPSTGFSAHGANAEAAVFWLFNYVPKSYSIDVGDRCGGTQTATIKAYPVNQVSAVWKVGKYFSKAEEMWNALPPTGCEPKFPKENSSVSFANAWKEKSASPEAYLWWQANAGFNPLIGIDCKIRLAPGAIPLPTWITNYVDLGVYLTLDGAVNFNLGMEHGENGVTGTGECAGAVGGGLLGVVRAGDVISVNVSGHMNFIEASLKVAGKTGWIVYSVDLGSGKLEANVSIETWGGWIEWQRTWLIWDGVKWYELKDQQLYQYAKG
ncbi:MAG: hypothetical protein WD077_07180 [Bacteroidia bacterium]